MVTKQGARALLPPSLPLTHSHMCVSSQYRNKNTSIALTTIIVFIIIITYIIAYIMAFVVLWDPGAKPSKMSFK